MSIDIKRKKLELARVSLAKEELEFKIFEREEEIRRLKDMVKIQEEKIKEIEDSLKEQGE